MFAMDRLIRPLAVAAATLALLVPAAGRALETQQYGEVSYVSGGVGAEEREELEAQGPQYNLKLVLARGDGAFVADVGIHISDRRGGTVLEAVSAGPWFYARLPAGSYRVQADLEGTSRSASVTVPARGQARLVFHFGPPGPRGDD